jgi:hypothetical protein
MRRERRRRRKEKRKWIFLGKWGAPLIGRGDRRRGNVYSLAPFTASSGYETQYNMKESTG